MYCGSYKVDTLPWNIYPSFTYMSIFHKYHSFIMISINLTPFKLYHNCHFPAFISPPSSVPSQTMIRGFNVFGSYLMHGTIFNYSEGTWLQYRKFSAMIKVWYGVIIGLFAAYIWTLTVAVPSVQIHRSAFRDCNSKHCTLQATGPFTTGDSL